MEQIREHQQHEFGIQTSMWSTEEGVEFRIIQGLRERWSVFVPYGALHMQDRLHARTEMARELRYLLDQERNLRALASSIVRHAASR